MVFFRTYLVLGLHPVPMPVPEASCVPKRLSIASEAWLLQFTLEMTLKRFSLVLSKTPESALRHPIPPTGGERSAVGQLTRPVPSGWHRRSLCPRHPLRVLCPLPLWPSAFGAPNTGRINGVCVCWTFPFDQGSAMPLPCQSFSDHPDWKRCAVLYSYISSIYRKSMTLMTIPSMDGLG